MDDGGPTREKDSGDLEGVDMVVWAVVGETSLLSGRHYLAVVAAVGGGGDGRAALEVAFAVVVVAAAVVVVVVVVADRV